MMIRSINPRNQNGFTILELMIATVVLSVILLIATMTIMGMGKLYYKGLNATHANDTARNVIADISQHIEFSAQAPVLVRSPKDPSCPVFPVGSSTSLWCLQVGSSTVYAYCIDSTRYSFVVNTPYTDGINHVLWEDTMNPGVTTCQPVDVLTASTPSDSATLSGSGKELLLPGMRLTGFEIAKNPSTYAYDITVDVAYGDNDLLTLPPATAPSPNAHPTVQFATYAPAPVNIHCKSIVGDQFCATADLSTSVMRRLE